jgi:hypothetical protein
LATVSVLEEIIYRVWGHKFAGILDFSIDFYEDGRFITTTHSNIAVLDAEALREVPLEPAHVVAVGHPACAEDLADRPSVTDLVLCERVADVERALTVSGVRGRTWLALTPVAAARLVRAGVAYRRVEDFCAEEEFCRGAADRVADLRRWADRLDGSLAEAVPEFRASGFVPARGYFFFLAWLANALFYRARGLNAVGRAVRFDRVTWFRADVPGDFGDDLGFRTSLPSLWGAVIPHWVTNLAATSHSEPSVASPEVARSGGRLGKTLGRHRALLRREGGAAYLRRCLRALAAPVHAVSRSPASAEGAVILLHDGYDVGITADALRRRGQRCVRWQDLEVAVTAPSLSVKARLAALWQRLADDDRLAAPFRDAGVDLWPVAAPRLRRFVTEVVPTMHAHFEGACARFRRERPAGLLAAYAEDVWHAPTFDAARACGVPTVVYQHGGLLGVCEDPLWRETDRYIADHFLVYGDGVARYLEDDDRRYGPPRARTVIVGSARLDRFRTRRRAGGHRARRRPVVLYVPDMLRGNIRYLSCNDYPDVSFFELQCRLVGLFREHRDVDLIYKAFNDTIENPVVAEAAALPNVRVVRYLEGKVTTLMWEADLIVFDIPSTALLEALVTTAPIVVFADRRSLLMRSEARDKLRRRCMLSETPDEFIADLRRVLAAGRFERVSEPDPAFERAYASADGDGGSAERAAEAIISVVSSGHPAPVDGMR